MTREELLQALRNRGITQREVASVLIASGIYDEDSRQSLKVRLNMALNGKRVSEGYQLLLQQVETVIFGE